MTHKQMVRRAASWLANTKHCGAVLCEIKTWACQIPDAIGWLSSTSISVECKTSRSDFKADAYKPHIMSDCTVGEYRYYMAPKGVLSVNDLPEGYGLLEVSEHQVRVVKDAAINLRSVRAMQEEMLLLVSALRRVQDRAFLVVVPELGNCADSLIAKQEAQ